MAPCVAHCAVWEYWRHAMHFFISGCPGILGPNSQEEKTGPGM